MQNVTQTASGVDSSTGFTTDMVAGRVSDPTEVKRITQNLHREGQGTREHMMPIFDEMGQVWAYERALDPAMTARLERDTNLARMIGVWRGRQVEEAQAGIFNQELINRLYEMYQADVGNGSAVRAGYVNLLGGGIKDMDPVLYDALKLVGSDAWNYAQEKFGEGAFWVRRDMLNDAFGYRKASIGDAWTGNTRWSEKTQQVVRDLALAVPLAVQGTHRSAERSEAESEMGEQHR